MKILVTGCAGFIGFHLTRRLLDKGHHVVGVDNLNGYYSPQLKHARLAELGIDPKGLGQGRECSAGNFSFLHYGIEDAELYLRHLNDASFDVVCHLAAQAGVRYSITNPDQYITANIDGFFRILEYCRHRRPGKLVFASSSSVYGNSAKVPYRESDPTDMPVSLYAATKKAGEALAYSYASLYGVETIGLRFFTVYGPWGRPDMAPFLFTKAIMESQPIEVFNHGKMSRDFTYVDDIIEGVCNVMFGEPRGERPEKFRIYNIGNSRPVGLGDFIGAIEEAAGKKAERVLMPMQPGDVVTTWADTSRLEADYGYAPSTPIEAGIKAFMEWYKDFYGNLKN